jgi:uncharacterized protein YdhG (YjbR/CyaY superfamily)
MQGKTNAATLDEYIENADEPRRSDLRALDELVRSSVPELKPTMEFGMPGYGTYHYRYASGKEGDWMLIGFANNKQYISLYVTCVTEDGKHLAESYQPKLPKASIGRSCIRFKRLSDVDTEVLSTLFRTAAANPPAPLF